MAKASKAQVTFRMANGAKMAKSRKGKGKRPKHRKNPSRRAGTTHRRRRRNPGGKFSDRFLKLAGAAALAVGGGVVSYVAMSKLSTYGQAAEYAVPAVLLATGAAIAKSHPLLGAGLGIGAVAPFVPLAASKVLALMPASSTPSTVQPTPNTAQPTVAPATPVVTNQTTTTGISRAFRQMRAMGAVQMGAVQMGRAGMYRNVQGVIY